MSLSEGVRPCGSNENTEFCILQKWCRKSSLQYGAVDFNGHEEEFPPVVVSVYMDVWYTTKSKQNTNA